MDLNKTPKQISKSAKEYKQRLSPDGSQTQFGSQLKVCIENSKSVFDNLSGANQI